MVPNIRKVVPTENWQLIIEFDNNEIRILDTEQLRKNGYSFLGYRHKLNAFKFKKNGITWKNKQSLDYEYL